MARDSFSQGHISKNPNPKEMRKKISKSDTTVVNYLNLINCVPRRETQSMFTENLLKATLTVQMLSILSLLRKAFKIFINQFC